MNNKAHLRPQDYDSNGDIIPMACKEEKGDLISRSALKEEVNKKKVVGRFNTLLLIDNAPTVDIPTELCKGCRFLKDCETCEEKLRPQGEWNEIQAGMFACPFCGARPHKDFKNFCAKCGADMRKGGAV